MDPLVVQVWLRGRLLQSVPFDRPLLRIGRMKENEVVIDNLSVSRFHARLRLEDGRVFLEDNGSENGCWVNGERVLDPLVLGPSDTVQLGKHQVRVRTDPEAVPTRGGGDERSDPWDARATYLAGPGTQARMLSITPPPAPGATQPHEEPNDMQRDDPSQELIAEPLESTEAFALEAVAEVAPLAEAELAEPAAPLQPQHAGLLVQRDGVLVRAVPWDGDELIAGRSRDCQVPLQQEEVSRQHATFRRDGDRFEVVDLGSINGTFVNDDRVGRHTLQVGDVVRIESFEITFVLDHEPVDRAFKCVETPSADEPEQDAGAFTMIQEVMPDSGGHPEPPSGADLFSGFDESLGDDKELSLTEVVPAAPRASSVQDLGGGELADRELSLEVGVRWADLPPALRAALEAAGDEELRIPVTLRVRGRD
ncbi:MAG: FHA domain-containing protein [Myxococcota bacterium]|nr:FHA domain-containing protein [Myxococcota bacterium]